MYTLEPNSHRGLDWGIMGPLFTGGLLLFFLFTKSITATKVDGYKKTRTIDGSRFVTHSIVKKKTEADGIASRMRAKGKKARVEQRKGAWLVLVSS